jgi:hypothetical protein
MRRNCIATYSDAGCFSSALGPEVVRALDRVGQPDSRARLALAVTFAASDVMVADRGAAVIIADLWRRAGYRPPVRCDTLATDTGLSFAEAWSLAARHLAKTGRARQAEAARRSGMTVRALLRAVYGVKAGPEWDAAAERRAFLRRLSQTRRRERRRLQGDLRLGLEA